MSESDEFVTIGLTQRGIEKLGFPQEIEFPSDGDSFRADETLVSIDGSEGKIDVEAPISGIVREVNRDLQEEPENLSDDPYDEGWLVRIEPENKAGLKNFLSPNPS